MTTTDNVRHVLETHAILLDTCFAMQPGFADFVKEYQEAFAKNPILIPALVVGELRKLCGNEEEQCRADARKSLTIVENLVRNRRATIRHEESDVYADLVIQRVVEQHMLSHDMVVLTTDVGLMLDLRAKQHKFSVRSRHSLEVIKLHGKSQKPVFFYPDQTDMVYSTNNSTNNNRQLHPVNASPSPPRPMPQPFKRVSQVAACSNQLLTVTEELDTRSSVRLPDGTAITLGKKLAAGGEGAIYEISGRVEVCKLYFGTKLTEGRRDKIQLMVNRRVDHAGICWPIAPVTDSSGVFRGFVMTRASGQPLGHTLFLPQQFLRSQPHWTRKDSVTIALSIMKCIDTLHRMNVLIGDINPQNILFTDPRHVYIVDCDSFQVEGFPCPVGTVNFTAPEIQGVDYGTILREEKHELFAVATLLFMILLPGKCPYSHTGGADGATNIRNMEFAYTGDWKNGSAVAPKGIWTYCWGHLSHDLRRSFDLSFKRENRDVPRVKPSEWIILLRRYLAELNDPAKVFTGPLPQVGYDLSILPRSRKYKPEEADQIPRDGTTGFDRLLDNMSRNSGRGQGSSVPSARPSYRTHAFQRPFRRQPIHRSAGNDVFDERVTFDALEAIHSQRRSTALVVGAIALVITGIVCASVGAPGMVGLIFAIMIFIYGFNFSRNISRSDYYSLPGSMFANGDHRCIYCGYRGSNGRGIYTHGAYKENTKYHDCSKCGHNLFTS